MKIHELLKDFSGADVKVIINDKFDFSEHVYYGKGMAIIDYGYYSVKNWTIDGNSIIIEIQSQF